MKWFPAWLAIMAVTTAAAGGDDSADRARLGWFTRDLATPSRAYQVTELLRQRLSRADLQLLTTAELLQRLRLLDAESGLAEQATRLINQGKRQHLGMELEQAAASLQQAAQLLRQGFFRYHEPARLAEPLLLLGVVLLESGRRDEAAKAFGRALNLVPGLQLSEAYYSPRVRRLVAEVRTELGPARPALLPPAEAERICQALRLAGLVTFVAERLGEQPVLRLGLFDQRLHSYRQLESAVLGEAADTAAQLAERLAPELAAVAGLPSEPAAETLAGAADGGSDGADDGPVDRAGADAGRNGALAAATDGGLPAADPGPRTPWYWRHWWIWPLAAAVVSTAVALPLTVFRHDVVRIEVH